jgi:hypothetical protein
LVEISTTKQRIKTLKIYKHNVSGEIKNELKEKEEELKKLELELEELTNKILYFYKANNINIPLD